jgi:hypothetical protein
MMKANGIRSGITILCSLLFVGHLIWPKLSLDLTSTFLLIVGLIPWLAPVIKSIELPGGFKIEVQDLKAATEKIVGSDDEPIKARAANIQTLAPDFEKAASFATLRQLAQEDPNLTLVGFRIELERRLNALATKHDVVTHHKSAGQLLRVLQARNIIPPKMAAGLADLVALGNQAAHGAEVSESAARWVLDTAPEVLDELDRLIESGQ